MHKRTISVYIGMPGCGKGTQAERFGKAYPDTELFSASDIIRKHLSDHVLLKNQFEAYMHAGELVPDGLIIPVINEYLMPLLENGAGKNIVFDGFPRTEGQARYLVDILERYERKDEATVVHITLGETTGEEAEVVLARVKQRYVCEGTNRHTWSSDELHEGKCPDSNCGAKVTQRPDDATEAKVRGRIDEYETQAIPALRYMENEAGLPIKRVNGLLTRDEVHQEILVALAQGMYESEFSIPKSRF